MRMPSMAAPIAEQEFEVSEQGSDKVIKQTLYVFLRSYGNIV